jgi:uncharacterized protein YbaR (Trm112 family)
MIDPKLLDMLRCPIDGSRLQLAENAVVNGLNEAIGRGEVRDRQDQKVSEPLDGGLVNKAANRLYPIRGGIPSLVVNEAIELDK